MRNINFREQMREKGFLLTAAAGLLFLMAVCLYVMTGRNEFTPELQKPVLTGWAGALIFSFVSLAWTNKAPAYAAYLCGLFAWLEFLSGQINYIVNVFVAIDGSSFSAAFLATAAAGLAAWILALAAGVRRTSVFGRKGKIRKRTGPLSRVLAVVSSTFLVVLTVGNDLAGANSSLINSTLKCTTYKAVEKDSGDVEVISYPTEYTTAEEVKEYGYSVAEEVESEGIVLLKNENDALPLAKGGQVSCFLNGSVNLNYATSGSSATDTSSYDTLKTALEAEEVDLTVNPELWTFYTEGDGAEYTPKKKLNRELGMQVYSANAAPWSAYGEVEDSFADYPDAAIVVVSRNSGEGMDISTVESDGTDGSYLSLSQEEREVLTQLAQYKKEGTIKSIVVVLNTALAMCADFIDEESYGIDACMWVGNLGCSGVNAVADVLVGNTVPSGRLADTYVKDNFSSPAMASWMLNENGVFSQEYEDSEELGLNSTQMYYGVYQEGIYVGYRYYETRYEDVVLKADGVGEYSYEDVVAYPFGYGLSYTDFEYSDMSVKENENGDYEVSVTVTNTGDTYSGKEVVQVYLQKPYTEYDKENGVEKASVELAGFTKTAVLSPGESETVHVTVERESFKSYDANGRGTYILDAGNYYLAVGRDSHDALNNILALKGFSEKDGMDAEGKTEMAALALEQAELDDTTYAVSEETGEKISNQLDFADINGYSGSGENKVTYVSRSDWEGTWPTEAAGLSVSDELLADLGSNKEIVEDETLSMPDYGEASGLTVAMLRGEPYDSEKWEQLLDQMTFSEQALLVSDGSFSTHAVASVGIGSTYEQDGPTGVVGSVTQLSFPSEGIWASSFNTELAEKVGDALGEDARINDIQGIYLPGINIHRSPYGGRTHEYFSEDPMLTGGICEAEIRGVQENGVIAHVKHFIFNDEEAQRNGIGIWLNEQSAREIYLRPWEYAVNPSRGNAHAIMTSFNRAGALWTSASENLVQNILRGEFGFDGYVITDMASSNAALFMTYVDGFMNGTDLFLGSGSESALDEYKSSPTFANRIRESAHHLLYALCNYSAVMDGVSASLRFESVTPWWQMALYAAMGASAAVFAVSVLLLVYSLRKTVTKTAGKSIRS